MSLPQTQEGSSEAAGSGICWPAFWVCVSGLPVLTEDMWQRRAARCPQHGTSRSVRLCGSAAHSQATHTQQGRGGRDGTDIPCGVKSLRALTCLDKIPTENKPCQAGPLCKFNTDVQSQCCLSEKHPLPAPTIASVNGILKF